MQQDLISQGLELTLFGMGTVVVFLTLLVFVTSGMSAFIARFFPPPPPPIVEASAIDARVLAVIAAAVHQHRHQATHSIQKQDQTP
ncbi:MAG: OadG family protein [Halieaceae bacterium]|nr:OadG family protein [Halieaceae bacterium]